jgi:hypothetical protein
MLSRQLARLMPPTLNISLKIWMRWTAAFSLLFSLCTAHYYWQPYIMLSIASFICWLTLGYDQRPSNRFERGRDEKESSHFGFLFISFSSILVSFQLAGHGHFIEPAIIFLGLICYAHLNASVLIKRSSLVLDARYQITDQVDAATHLTISYGPDGKNTVQIQVTGPIGRFTGTVQRPNIWQVVTLNISYDHIIHECVAELLRLYQNPNELFVYEKGVHHGNADPGTTVGGDGMSEII